VYWIVLSTTKYVCIEHQSSSVALLENNHKTVRISRTFVWKKEYPALQNLKLA
jgi:hypothetical protein